MEISSHILRRQFLFALVLLIGPMTLFPELLGTNLSEASAFNFLVELIVFTVAVFLLNRSFNILAITKSLVICLLVRVALGTAFGLLVSVMYALSPSVSITLGITGYLPAIILHVLATPFLVQPFVVQFGPEQSLNINIDKSSASAKQGRTTFAISKSMGVVSDVVSQESQIEPVSTMAETSEFTSPVVAKSELNGFDKATRYLGEDGSVFFAGVVDSEGLLMANFSRRNTIAEDWAPLSLLLFSATSSVLSRGHLEGLSKADLTLHDRRVIVARECESGYHLMVVADSNADDILNVRINQALEIVRKYVLERFPSAPVHNEESEYV